MSSRFVRGLHSIRSYKIRDPHLSSTATYATRSAMDPQTVSDIAKAEPGGPSKGSPAAQAQSQMTKQLNGR